MVRRRRESAVARAVRTGRSTFRAGRATGRGRERELMRDQAIAERMRAGKASKRAASVMRDDFEGMMGWDG